MILFLLQHSMLPVFQQFLPCSFCKGAWESKVIWSKAFSVKKGTRSEGGSDEIKQRHKPVWQSQWKQWEEANLFSPTDWWAIKKLQALPLMRMQSWVSQIFGVGGVSVGLCRTDEGVRKGWGGAKGEQADRVVCKRVRQCAYHGGSAHLTQPRALPPQPGLSSPCILW